MMLAATRLIALHKNKGMTVAACLKNRTDYIENPDKTEQGQPPTTKDRKSTRLNSSHKTESRMPSSA